MNKVNKILLGNVTHNNNKQRTFIYFPWNSVLQFIDIEYVTFDGKDVS